MTDDLPTAPEHDVPTEPAPPLRTTARVDLPDDGLVNGAGRIANIKHVGYPGAASILWCNAGAYRASHFHREDSHLLYVLEGEVRYLERSVGGTEAEIDETFGPEEAFDSPPMREHILIFSAPTILLSYADRPRTHEEHEADVVRVPRESWET